MKIGLTRSAFVCTGLLAAVLLITGCESGKQVAEKSDAGKTEKKDAHEGHDHAPGEHGKKGDGDAGLKHDTWWCDEHGVPEGECTRCNHKLIDDFKEKGDWCEEHELPDSQCFKCHPENEKKFAEKYEAKYGKKPPKPTE